MILKSYFKKFFFNCSSVDCSPKTEEMVNGKAFQYKRYPLHSPVFVSKTDTIRATFHDMTRGCGKAEEFVVEESCGISGEIDSVVIFRAIEAFGMTNVIGAAFGKNISGGMK